MAMLEARPYRPFKSSEEYLEAMKEDLAEWLSTLYPDLNINAENFMDRLDTGVALCKHANYVREAAEEYLVRRQARNKSMTRSMTSGIAGPILTLGNIHYLPGAKSGTFFARDNVSNFITWCRKGLKIIECLLFETDDLIMRKNEKHVILCLLEVARRGAKFGMLAPMLVQMERQIDREIAADNKAKGIGCGTQTETVCDGTQTDVGVGTESVATETDIFDDTDSENEDEEDEGPMLMYGPQPQIVTNDLKSLDEMVRDLVEQCSCPTQFPMVRVSEGKYRIGDTKVLIFVRILRSHVMVRVGGGWDTLSHYLDKHDPCRCKAQHRSSVAARLIPRTSNQSNGIELHKAQVIFERSPPSARKLISNFNNSPTTTNTTTPITNHQAPTVSASGNSNTNGTGIGLPSMTSTAISNKLSPSFSGNNKTQRSRSPTPQRKYLNHLNNINDNNATPLMNDKQQLNITQSNNLLTTTSPGLIRRSMSPSPRRLIDIRKKQTSLDSYNSGPKSLPLVNDVSNNQVQFDSFNLIQTDVNQQTSSTISTTTAPINTVNNQNGGNTTNDGTTNGSNKFENISDNGSEISDEGYRSLGVIQSNAQKRESIHSQTSMEDAETNARLDQTSSDSQLSPIDDTVSVAKTPEIAEADYASLPCESQTLLSGPQSLPAVLSENVFGNKFEQNGIYITDDEITVDIATAATRITNDNTANEEINDVTDSLKAIEITNDLAINGSGVNDVKNTKIPCSPRAQRRRSVDNSNCNSGSLQDLPSRTGLSNFYRSKPVYRSVRKPALTDSKRNSPNTTIAPRKTNIPAVKDVTNTWSGRTTSLTGGKNRPSINANTFTPPSNQSAANTTAAASATSTSAGVGAGVVGAVSLSSNNSPFDRNSKTRSSHILYDSNGRRVRGCSTSLNTSPVKNHSASPLAQQLLVAASSAKNDAQILEKMKAILSKYAARNQTPSKTSTNNKKHPVYEDFTTAWVHSNGNLERSSSCSPPTKMQSKRSSAASSCESTISHDVPIAISPRRDRGLSKIPTPIQRQRTELY